MAANDRNAILKRRARLVQSALFAAGLSVSSVAGCDGDTQPEPDTASQTDTQPEICLGALPEDIVDDTEPPPDTQPEVCLGAPLEDTVDDDSTDQQG